MPEQPHRTRIIDIANIQRAFINPTPLKLLLLRLDVLQAWIDRIIAGSIAAGLSPLEFVDLDVYFSHEGGIDLFREGALLVKVHE